jgi:hypothetical protein
MQLLSRRFSRLVCRPTERIRRGGRNERNAGLISQEERGVVIANDITVTVIDVRGDKVRLGVDARTKYPSTAARSTRRFGAK